MSTSKTHGQYITAWIDHINELDKLFLAGSVTIEQRSKIRQELLGILDDAAKRLYAYRDVDHRSD